MRWGERGGTDANLACGGNARCSCLRHGLDRRDGQLSGARGRAYYTAINSHLRPAEVQYIVDDCGATTLVASSAVADVVAGLVWPASRSGWWRAEGRPSSAERFDPLQCLQLIERHRVTHARFVPTMFVRLLQLPAGERPRFDLSSLRYVVQAAAPCPVGVKRRMLDWWGPIIHEYYAGTEDIGSSYITPEEWLGHPGSVGRPINECHIVDADGEEVSAGTTGLVYFGGGRPFRYHNDPEKTAAVTNDRGWRTLGEQVKAVIECVDPATAGPDLEAELLRYCRGELASHKCPGRSISSLSFPATRAASCTSACCGSAIGKVTTRS